MGSLKVEIDASEQEEVAQKLLEDFNCVPIFLPHDLHKSFIMGSLNISCGLFFITCCSCAPTMAIILTTSEHMLWNEYGQLFSRHASNVQRPLHTTISNPATAKPPSLALTWPPWCTPLPLLDYWLEDLQSWIGFSNHFQLNDSSFKKSISRFLLGNKIQILIILCCHFSLLACIFTILFDFQAFSWFSQFSTSMNKLHDSKQWNS